MTLLDDILARRRGHRHYDEELWAVMERAQRPRLINLSNDALQARLDQIDRNIQYLDNHPSPRDELGPERGWISPWWWLRIRHWTLLEFGRRGLAPVTTPRLMPMPGVARPFVGHMNSGERILVRLSRKPWLLETLRDGAIRFAPASSYDDAGLDAARADDEMGKGYSRPGQHLSVITASGAAIPVLGDATFTTRRQVERGPVLEPVPYWLSSFSTELDPRLFDEFASADPREDGCLVIFSAEEFMRRALRPLNIAAPHAAKRLIQNNYFDPYHPPSDGLHPIDAKAMSYAYQREARLVLDPEGGPILGGGGPLFVSIGSIEDIAAVYHRHGPKVAGTGPDTFLA